MTAVSIIIVSMNHLHFLKKLLKSIYQTATPEIDFETILVDNCSTDGTVEFIRQHYPQVNLLVNAKITGFAENNNLGIKKSSGRYILILNPDIELLPASVDNLFHFMETTPTVGIAGPMLLNPDDTYQYSVRRFMSVQTLLLRVFSWGSDNTNNNDLNDYLMKNMDRDIVQPVDWIIGAAMIIRRNSMEEVGLLDEKFFLYIEDQDWCYRMWKSGWSVHYNPSSRMIHDHQRASVKGGLSKKTYYHARSLLYFLLKHRIFRIPPKGSELSVQNNKY